MSGILFGLVNRFVRLHLTIWVDVPALISLSYSLACSTNVQAGECTSEQYMWRSAPRHPSSLPELRQRPRRLARTTQLFVMGDRQHHDIILGQRAEKGHGMTTHDGQACSLLPWRKLRPCRFAAIVAGGRHRAGGSQRCLRPCCHIILHSEARTFHVEARDDTPTGNSADIQFTKDLRVDNHSGGNIDSEPVHEPPFLNRNAR